MCSLLNIPGYEWVKRFTLILSDREFIELVLKVNLFQCTFLTEVKGTNRDNGNYQVNLTKPLFECYWGLIVTRTKEIKSVTERALTDVLFKECKAKQLVSVNKAKASSWDQQRSNQ